MGRIILSDKRRIVKQSDYNDLVINCFKKRRVWCARTGIYGYPYLNHLIELWPGGWE